MGLKTGATLKPGDFFIGLRQLFGIVLPGLVWLVTLMLWVAPESLPRWRSLNLADAVIAIVSAYLLGYAFLRWAFATGGLLGCLLLYKLWFFSTFLRWASKWIGNFQRLRTSRFITEDEKAEFEAGSCVSNVIQRRWQVSFPNLGCRDLEIKKTPHFLNWDHTPPVLPREAVSCSLPRLFHDKEKDLPDFAKAQLLGKPEIARRLDEIEADVNLSSNMVLPLLVLAVFLAIRWTVVARWRWNELGAWEHTWYFRRGGNPLQSWFVVISIILVACLFSVRAVKRRQDEIKDIYRWFLATAGSDLESAKGKAVGTAEP